MKKVEFLEEAMSRFLSTHLSWEDVVRDKRGLCFTVGRDIPKVAFVYIDFSVRSDRFLAGHGVGWSKSLACFHEARSKKVNAPFQPRDGSLRRLLTLDDPRDFHYEELYISTAELCKPFGGFDLTTEPPDEVLATMAAEINEFALPYLCLMLLKRHGISVTPEQLSSGTVCMID